MGGVHPPLRTFLISDFVLQDTKKFFASIIKIISGVCGLNFSDKWKVISVAPQRGDVHPVNPEMFFSDNK